MTYELDAHIHLVTGALRAALPFPVWVDDFWTGQVVLADGDNLAQPGQGQGLTATR